MRRRVVGYVFQELNLVPSLTAAENVALPLELDGQRPGSARRSAMEALDAAGLAAIAALFPDELSGGQQQQVAIVRALVGERRLLLADEPTGALDSATGDLVLASLRARCDAGVGAIVVTHQPRHAAWADRVVFLRDGALVDDTGPELWPAPPGPGYAPAQFDEHAQLRRSGEDRGAGCVHRLGGCQWTGGPSHSLPGGLPHPGPGASPRWRLGLGRGERLRRTRGSAMGHLVG